MLYTYRTATGDVSIEVSEYYYDILVQEDKIIKYSNEKESRPNRAKQDGQVRISFDSDEADLIETATATLSPEDYYCDLETLQENGEKIEQIYNYISTLPQLKQDVFRDVIMGKMSQTEFGRLHEITQQRVSKIQKSIINKLNKEYT